MSHAVLDGPSPDPEPAMSRRLRGLGPVGIVAIAVVLAGNFVFAPLSAVLVLVWAYASRTPWHAIGLIRPRSWLATLALGIAFGVALKLGMKAIVMPLLGADPINHAFRFAVGNAAIIPQMLFLMVVVAGIGEEILFRGYVFERLGKLLGTSRLATIATVVLAAALFGAAHYGFQGVPGVQQATIVGLLFGAIHAATRALPLLMITHASFDLTAYWIIYHDLESVVAHWVWG